MAKAKRRSFEKKYLQVPNETAVAPEIKSPSESISLEALGLIVNICSYSEEWDLHKTELYQRYAKNKRTSVNNAFKELVQAKYMFEYKYRVGKKWEHVYQYDIIPYTDEQIKILRHEAIEEHKEIWDVDFAHPKMDSRKWTAENQHISNTIGTQNGINEIQTKPILDEKIIDDEEEPFEINNYAFKEFVKEFQENFPNRFDNQKFQDIYEQMILQKLAVITFQEGANQARYMEKRQKEGKLDLGDYATYFVGGIKKKRTSQQSALEERILAKAAKELKEKKERKERERQTKRPPVYNWLEQ